MISSIKLSLSSVYQLEGDVGCTETACFLRSLWNLGFKTDNSLKLVMLWIGCKFLYRFFYTFIFWGTVLWFTPHNVDIHCFFPCENILKTSTAADRNQSLAIFTGEQIINETSINYTLFKKKDKYYMLNYL